MPRGAGFKKYSSAAAVYLSFYLLIIIITCASAYKATRYGHSSSDSSELQRRDASIEEQTDPSARDGRGSSNQGYHRGSYSRSNGHRKNYDGGRGRNNYNPQETCPCVRRQDTGECVTYDHRFQAASLEEAVVNFPDLQIGPNAAASAVTVTGTPAAQQPQQVGAASTIAPPGPPSPPVLPPPPPGPDDENRTLPASVAKSRVSGVSGGGGSGGGKLPPEFVLPEPASLLNVSGAGPPPPPSGLCGDNAECQACSAALLNRLSRTGLLDNAQFNEAARRLGLPTPMTSDGQQQPTAAAPSRIACEKYHFGRRIQGFQYSRKGGAANPRTGSVSGVGNDTGGSATSPEEKQMNSVMAFLQQKGEEIWAQRQNQTSSRARRQAAALSLGQQYKIDCSKRGEPVEQGSTWVGLCNVCWAWRKLPTSYFPQYINELICDTDHKCMSGWGTCQQRHKSVDILHNTGTASSPKWKQVTISVANYCDCEVQSGSGMHNFIAK